MNDEIPEEFGLHLEPIINKMNNDFKVYDIQIQNYKKRYNIKKGVKVL